MKNAENNNNLENNMGNNTENNVEQIDCSLFQEMIFPYLDDNLTDEATACFLEHARTCPDCQAALEEARSFEFSLIGSFVNMDPPVDLADKIMADLHKAPVVPLETAEPQPVVRAEPAAAATTAANAKPSVKTVKKLSKKKIFTIFGGAAAAAALVFVVNLGINATPEDSKPINVADGGIGSGIISAGQDINRYGVFEADADTDGSDVLNSEAQNAADQAADKSVFTTTTRKPASSAGKTTTTASSNGKKHTTTNGGKKHTTTNSGSTQKPNNNQQTNNNSGNSGNSGNTNNSGNSGNSNNNSQNGGNSNSGSNNGSGGSSNNNTSTVVLPKPSYGTETTGTLNQRLLAAYDKESVYMPSVSLDNKTVSYYTKINDKVYLWKCNLETAAEPVCEGAVTDTNFRLKNTTPVYSVNTTVFSPDMTMLSMNARGDNAGVWVSNLLSNGTLSRITTEGGGDLLAWASNSSKFVYTNSEGDLYVAYPIEKRIVLLFEGNVKDVAWSSDNKTLVLTNQEENEQLSLYTIQVP